jgi:hypothetical protein
VLIEICRFGYESRHDAREEKTQGAAIVGSGPDTFGIRCVGNYVAGTAGRAPAYALFASGPAGRGCTIEHAGGLTTREGPWNE